MNLCSWIHFHLWVLQEKKVRLSMKRFDQSFGMRTLLRKYVTVAKPFFPVYFSKNKRMLSSRMRTARLLTVSRSIPYVSGGGGLPNSPGCTPPLDADTPWMQIPLDADPPALDADPPGGRHLSGCRPPRCRPPFPLDADPPDAYIPKMQIPQIQTPTWMHTTLVADLPGSRPPSHVTSDACWEANHPCGQTNTCENITLPQTLSVGDKNGKNYYATRMHSSRMCTTHFSGCLSCHACPLPCTPPCHACPPVTHVPCHANPHHACPLPCIPLCHTCPPATHAPQCIPQLPPCMPPMNRMTDRPVEKHYLPAAWFTGGKIQNSYKYL